MRLFDTLFHRWLGVPYALHVEINRKSASRKAPTVLFIHGIGNSGLAWEEVIKQLPDSFHAITIDLLGFGNSPRPSWAVYSAKTQARSVIMTIARLRISGPVIIVGHSLGSLVAVEVAKRYPVIMRSLILCSPPFYNLDEATRRRIPNSDRILRSIYRLAKKHPEQLIRISTLALKLGLVNKAFSLTHDDIDSYMGALEASIINQTSLEDAEQLKKPITIIVGKLDPVVVKRNIKRLAARNKRVKTVTILAGHEVTSRFIPLIVREVAAAATKKRRKKLLHKQS